MEHLFPIMTLNKYLLLTLLLTYLFNYVYLLFMNSESFWNFISHPFVVLFYYILGCTFLRSTHTLPATVHYTNLFKQICLNNLAHYDLPFTSKSPYSLELTAFYIFLYFHFTVVSRKMVGHCNEVIVQSSTMKQKS